MDRVIERADRGAAAEQAATALLDAAGTLSAGGRIVFSAC
jgi:hypothetical protein